MREPKVVDYRTGANQGPGHVLLVATNTVPSVRIPTQTT